MPGARCARGPPPWAPDPNEISPLLPHGAGPHGGERKRGKKESKKKQEEGRESGAGSASPPPDGAHGWGERGPPGARRGQRQRRARSPARAELQRELGNPAGTAPTVPQEEEESCEGAGRGAPRAPSKRGSKTQPAGAGGCWRPALGQNRSASVQTPGLSLGRRWERTKSARERTGRQQTPSTKGSEEDWGGRCPQVPVPPRYTKALAQGSPPAPPPRVCSPLPGAEPPAPRCFTTSKGLLLLQLHRDGSRSQCLSLGFSKCAQASQPAPGQVPQGTPWPGCSGWHRPEQHSCPTGQTPASGTLVHNGAARVQAGMLVSSLSCQLLIRHRDWAHLLPKVTPDELSSPRWRLCWSNGKRCRRKQRNQCQVPALSLLTLLLRTKPLLTSLPGPAEDKASPRDKGMVSAQG